jgi:hypothetical protein
MRVLVYKRTHNGDPDASGCFGAYDCIGTVRDLAPEKAAQIIGGIVLTHQLIITFDEDDCPFVLDGHVMVV